MINTCIDAGLVFEIEELSSNKLEGVSFVITGKLGSISRSETKSKLESIGAKVLSSVSSKTDYLICGKDPGKNKLDKSNKLNIKIINESELIDLINV